MASINPQGSSASTPIFKKLPLPQHQIHFSTFSLCNRHNLLFHRTRNNCQIVTQKDPLFLLTVPTCAVIIVDPINFEVQLTGKGKTESQDKLLNFGVLHCSHACYYLGPSPNIVTEYVARNRSEAEFRFALLQNQMRPLSVFVVVDGSWPLHLRGLVTRTASIDCGDIVLQYSRDGGIPASHSGVIELSRRIVSVELCGEMKVDVVISQFDKINNVVVRSGCFYA